MDTMSHRPLLPPLPLRQVLTGGAFDLGLLVRKRDYPGKAPLPGLEFRVWGLFRV